MKNVHYSVPDSLVGEKVHVGVYSEKIVILHGKEKVASSTQLLRWRLVHQAGALFAYTFPYKPGALPHSVVWQRAPKN